MTVSDVTIDLMGFCLTGSDKQSGANIGIKIGTSNVEVRKGPIQGFG